VEFDHMGIPIAERRAGMRLLEATRCWLTSPGDHPFRVEWLHFEEGSPAHELIRRLPHVAYRVESLDEAMEGYGVIAEPFNVFGEVRVSFVEVDGAPVEFVQSL
jgi:hypothetical protein